MTDQRATESTEAEILARMKALRTPTEPKGQPEDGEVVDVSVETPEDDNELQPEEVEQQTIADQTDDSLTETEELAETLEADSSEEESLYLDLDGEEISLDDVRKWKKGHMQEADYTQKTQKVAEQRKSLEASEAKQQGALNDLQSHIDLMTGMLDSEFEGVDWDELRDLDTGEYLKLKERKEGRQGKINAATAKRQELQNSRLLERQTAGNQALVALNPQWIKDGQATQAYNDDQKFLAAFAEDNKLTKDDIASVLTNGSIMQAMIDSAKYRANIAKAPAIAKKVKKAPVIVRGKRATANNVSRQIQAAEAKLKSTGRMEDALALKKLKRQSTN